jgi:hypothetical protein
MAVPPPDADDAGIRASEAVELLLDWARAARPQAEDDNALATAARITRDLDGLPLAIELAAARVKALSLDDIANRLDDRFRFLVSWRRLSAARHRTLREAMDWSFGSCRRTTAPPCQAIGVRGRVHPRCGHPDLPRRRRGAGARPIERLVAASLVVPEEHGEMRYRLLRPSASTPRIASTNRLLSRCVEHAQYFLRVANAPT